MMRLGRRFCTWFWGITQRRIDQRMEEERRARAYRNKREQEILQYERSLNQAIARGDAAEVEKARAAIRAITAGVRREQDLMQNLFGGGIDEEVRR